MDTKLKQFIFEIPVKYYLNEDLLTINFSTKLERLAQRINFVDLQNVIYCESLNCNGSYLIEGEVHM